VPSVLTSEPTYYKLDGERSARKSLNINDSSENTSNEPTEAGAPAQKRVSQIVEEEKKADEPAPVIKKAADPKPAPAQKAVAAPKVKKPTGKVAGFVPKDPPAPSKSLPKPPPAPSNPVKKGVAHTFPAIPASKPIESV
jgi:hypothetical protein